jgi:pyridoxamine 5'-phosphate oxidase
VASRAEIERMVSELALHYEDAELPVPADWGGYRLEPEAFEFWQHREDRLHDRLRYTRAPGRWQIDRLAP